MFERGTTARKSGASLQYPNIVEVQLVENRLSAVVKLFGFKLATLTDADVSQLERVEVIPRLGADYVSVWLKGERKPALQFTSGEASTWLHEFSDRGIPTRGSAKFVNQTLVGNYIFWIILWLGLAAGLVALGAGIVLWLRGGG